MPECRSDGSEANRVAGDSGLRENESIPTFATPRNTDAVKKYGTKWVAHRDKAAPATVPTFKELDDALEIIKNVLIQHLRLVRRLDHQEPVWTYDWKAIFREPWIPPDASGGA